MKDSTIGIGLTVVLLLWALTILGPTTLVGLFAFGLAVASFCWGVRITSEEMETENLRLIQALDSLLQKPVELERKLGAQRRREAKEMGNIREQEFRLRNQLDDPPNPPGWYTGTMTRPHILAPRGPTAGPDAGAAPPHPNAWVEDAIDTLEAEGFEVDLRPLED